MNIAKTLGTLSTFAAAMLAVHTAQADEPFINPDWANHAWYLGAGVGQSRAKIDDTRLIQSAFETLDVGGRIVKRDRSGAGRGGAGRQLADRDDAGGDTDRPGTAG